MPHTVGVETVEAVGDAVDRRRLVTQHGCVERESVLVGRQRHFVRHADALRQDVFTRLHTPSRQEEVGEQQRRSRVLLVESRGVERDEAVGAAEVERTIGRLVARLVVELVGCQSVARRIDLRKSVLGREADEAVRSREPELAVIALKHTVGRVAGNHRVGIEAVETLCVAVEEAEAVALSQEPEAVAAVLVDADDLVVRQRMRVAVAVLIVLPPSRVGVVTIYAAEVSGQPQHAVRVLKHVVDKFVGLRQALKVVGRWTVAHQAADCADVEFAAAGVADAEDVVGIERVRVVALSIVPLQPSCPQIHASQTVGKRADPQRIADAAKAVDVGAQAHIVHRFDSAVGRAEMEQAAVLGADPERSVSVGAKLTHVLAEM